MTQRVEPARWGMTASANQISMDAAQFHQKKKKGRKKKKRHAYFCMPCPMSSSDPIGNLDPLLTGLSGGGNIRSVRFESSPHRRFSSASFHQPFNIFCFALFPDALLKMNPTDSFFLLKQEVHNGQNNTKTEEWKR